MLASVLCGFALFHFFYNPHKKVESIAQSTETYELRPGDPDVRLAVLPEVKPGTEYRVAATLAWQAIEAGDKTWNTARMVLFSFNSQGHWIPASHVVCSLTGSGKGSFETVLAIPEGAVETRLIFQHRGKSGSARLKRFSLQQVDLKPSVPWVFRSLQAVWFLMAGWTLWHLRLWRRWSGLAVVWVAGLIAAGMLIPGKVVREAPDRMASLMRPAETPAVAVSAAPVKATPPASAVVSQAEDAVRNGRELLAEDVSSLDPHLWGHAGLFLLLGGVCGVYFKIPFRNWAGVLSLFAGGVLYAIAAELLQVTVLTRQVQISDIGVNVLGWLIGLAVVALFAGKNRPNLMAIRTFY